MKIKNAGRKYFILVLLVGVLQLNADPATNTAPVIKESWAHINDLWGNVSLSDTKKAALKGDVLAQYFVGRAYQNGRGVDKDLPEAFKWEKMAADNGLVRAQKSVGSMFYSGAGVAQDYSAAAKYFLLAAEQGNAPAQCSIAYLFRKGLGVVKNTDESIKWYRKAADQGIAEAQRDLAYAYQSGLIGSTNYVEAAKLSRLAAVQGDAEAQSNLGWLLANGLGVQKNYDEAKNWFQKAAKGGAIHAASNLAWLDFKTFDEQFSQARKYQNGEGVPQNMAAAFKWMEKAAQHDQSRNSEVSDAIYDLALMYENGEGVETNKDKARELILQAAAGFQPDACYRAGVMSESGEGLPQDYYQAARYYYNAVYCFNGRKYKGKAAESLLRLYADGRGLTRTNQEPADFVDNELANRSKVINATKSQVSTPLGEYYAGLICRQNTLIPQDLVEAAVRFQIAANAGLELANEALADLEPKLSTAQKEEAAKRFRGLKMKYDGAKIVL